jgi:hypothetical protein
MLKALIGTFALAAGLAGAAQAETPAGYPLSLAQSRSSPAKSMAWCSNLADILHRDIGFNFPEGRDYTDQVLARCSMVEQRHISYDQADQKFLSGQCRPVDTLPDINGHYSKC